MTRWTRTRSGTLALAVVLALALGGAPALAAGSDPEPRPAPGDSKQKKEKKSEQQFRDGYKAAYALVQAGRFDSALAAFRALDRPDHPDVANYIGYLNRKLGDYAQSQVWYERALAADPTHVRTWQYYGMWHLEQGNLLKARDHLDRIRLICGGTGCKEWVDLNGAIDGTVTY